MKGIMSKNMRRILDESKKNKRVNRELYDALSNHHGGYITLEKGDSFYVTNQPLSEKELNSLKIKKNKNISNTKKQFSLIKIINWVLDFFR